MRFSNLFAPVLLCDCHAIILKINVFSQNCLIFTKVKISRAWKINFGSNNIASNICEHKGSASMAGWETNSRNRQHKTWIQCLKIRSPINGIKIFKKLYTTHLALSTKLIEFFTQPFGNEKRTRRKTVILHLYNI